MKHLPTAGKQRGVFDVVSLCLVLVLVLVIGGSGYALSSLKDSNDDLKRQVKSLQDGAALVNRQAESANKFAFATRERLDAEVLRAGETREQLRKVLYETPDVRLPAPVGRVLRASVPSHQPAATAARAGSEGAPAKAAERGGDGDGFAGDVSCKAIAEWGRFNAQEVAAPSAIQVEALQAFYEEQRRLIAEAQR